MFGLLGSVPAVVAAAPATAEEDRRSARAARILEIEKMIAESVGWQGPYWKSQAIQREYRGLLEEVLVEAGVR
jgi:hypothetical protein